MGLLIRLLALYLGGLPLYAGTTGATHLLTRGPGAAPAALGNAVLPVVADPTALYWNPAGLASAGGAVTGEHLFLYDGARYNFVGLSLPSRLGHLGLGVLQLHRGGITARRSISDPGIEVSNTQSDYLLGFARPLGSRWSLGSTLNLLDFNLAGYRDLGVGADLGVQGSLPRADGRTLRRPVWRFGGVLKNLLEPGIRLKDEDESLPRELRLALGLGFDGLSRFSFRSGEIHRDRVQVLASARRLFGEPELHLSLGLSYELHDLLTFRLGFEDNLVAGMGLTTGDRRFVIDYAVESRPLSKNHRFTLSYRFAEPKESARPAAVERDDGYASARRRAAALSDEHYARGKAAFADLRFRDCLEDLELAALLLPDDPERRSFYERAREVERRARRQSLPEASEAEFHELHSRAMRLAERCRYAQALELAADAELVRSSTSSARALSGWISRMSAETRAELLGVVHGAGETPTQEALLAAEELLRGFPDDAEARQAAQALRARGLKGARLDARERLYLRKLYYLAAAKFVRREYPAASDLLHEVLRRAPADEFAAGLRDAMLDRGLIPMRMIGTTRRER